MRVAVEGFGSEKELEISDHVPGHEQTHGRARGRHDVFLAERRTKKTGNDLHAWWFLRLGESRKRPLERGRSVVAPAKHRQRDVCEIRRKCGNVKAANCRSAGEDRLRERRTTFGTALLRP